METNVPSSDRIRLTVGRLSFVGHVESQAAPETVALIRRLLPLEGSAMHARWSGEAAWMPLGIELRVPAENAIAFPQPGQLLLYAGTRSEPELLIPYGSCWFACRAGQLAGNHVITLDDTSRLRVLGESLLRKGVQPLSLSFESSVQSTVAGPAAKSLALLLLKICWFSFVGGALYA